MIFKETHLKVVDNSGAKIAKCIHIYGVGGRDYAKPGDKIVVSIRQKYSNTAIEIGSIHKAVVVIVKKGIVRSGGEKISFSENGVVLLKNDDVPLGTRILTPVMLELRLRGYLKVISLSLFTI